MNPDAEAPLPYGEGPRKILVKKSSASEEPQPISKIGDGPRKLPEIKDPQTNNPKIEYDLRAIQVVTRKDPFENASAPERTIVNGDQDSNPSAPR